LKEAFEAEGDVASLDLLAALCALGREGSTGRAIFSRGAERIAFVIEKGVLVEVEAPAESSPPEVLVRSGKLQRETYEALVIPAGEDRFAVATASGVVSKKEAAWGRKISAIESLASLLSWTDGSYVFEPLAPEIAAGFRLPIDKWILELFLRSNDRALVMSRIGPTDLPLLKADSFAPAFAALGLTADADAVAGLVDGERSVEEIVRKSRADEFAVLKLLAALISLRLVRPSYESPFPEAAETPAPADPLPDAPADALEDLPDMPPPVPPGSEAEPFAETAEAPLPAEPISLPLFALTAPEPEEPAEPPMEPAAPEPPPGPRGRGRLWAALLFAVLAAALFWKLGRRRPVSFPPPAAPASAGRSAPAPTPAPARPTPPEPARRGPEREEPARKSIVAVAPPAIKAPKPSLDANARRQAAPWKRTIEANRRAFEHPGAFGYAIQLELACEEATVTKALRADPSGRQIWIVPYDFRGRSCYRVLWGRYKTLPKARDAKTSVPAMFLRGGNHPAVISLPGSGSPAASR